MEQLRHIGKAKTWLAFLGVLTLAPIISDLMFTFRGEDRESWTYSINLRFKQGDTIIENKKGDSQSGIWVSDKQYRLMKRGKPDWVRNVFLLGTVTMAGWHLAKAQSIAENHRASE